MSEKEILQLTAQMYEHQQDAGEAKCAADEFYAQAKESEKWASECKAKIEKLMLADGVLKQEIGDFVYNIVRKPQSVEVLCDSKDIPDEYTKTSISADKTKIGKNLRAGIKLNFARLSEREEVLTIKQNVKIKPAEKVDDDPFDDEA